MVGSWRRAQRLRAAPRQLNAVEWACISPMLHAHSKLEVMNGRVVTSTESGRNSCQAFLTSVGEVSDKLRVKRECRGYRQSFSSNYKILFPDSGRHYRVNVLVASIDQNEIIYVNHEKFDFSVETLRKARQLQDAWSRMNMILQSKPFSIRSRRILDELRSALARLDADWACFEKAYISDLIGIEAKARNLIEQVVVQERLLTLFEGRLVEHETPEGTADVCHRRLRLVSSVAWLNSVANQRRKGRDDLDHSILEDALAEIRGQDSSGAPDRSVAKAIAARVVASFRAVRTYLRQVASCLERVDPHLCKNPALVETLVEWEESWEFAAKYQRNAPLLDAVRDVVAELRDVQEVAPALQHMCSDCDVELFFCVPRLIWLRFLRRPAACGELLRTLLPHRFPDASSLAVPGASHDGARPVMDCIALPDEGCASRLFYPLNFLVDIELLALHTCYRSICVRLRHFQSLTSRNPKDRRPCILYGESASAIWGLFARLAVVRNDGAEELNTVLPSTAEGESIKRDVGDFMRKLERWSIELQRNTPEQWNWISSVVVQCVKGGRGKTHELSEEFHM